MTLQEFEDAVYDLELTGGNLVNKWKRFCILISKMSEQQIADFITSDGLQHFIEHENLDFFGTEGLGL